MSWSSGPYGDPAVRSIKLSIASAFDLPPEMVLGMPEREPNNRELYMKALGLSEQDVAEIAFPGGTFIYLDSGTLDLGIIRDETVNSGNDFEVFGEMFE